VTVDPRTDTPQHVRPFLERRHALAVDYLIGTVRQLRPVWKAYFILPAIDTGNADVHSSDVRIFDRRSLWVATQHAGVDLNSANLVHDVRTASGARRLIQSSFQNETLCRRGLIPKRALSRVRARRAATARPAAR